MKKNIKNLLARKQDVMNLWLDEVPYKEAAEMLEINIGIYKSQVHHGKKKKLKKYYV